MPTRPLVNDTGTVGQPGARFALIMKPISIAAAGLIPTGGGLVVLGIMLTRNQEPESGFCALAAQTPSVAERVQAPALPRVGIGSDDTVGEAAWLEEEVDRDTAPRQGTRTLTEPRAVTAGSRQSPLDVAHRSTADSDRRAAHRKPMKDGQGHGTASWASEAPEGSASRESETVIRVPASPLDPAVPADIPAVLAEMVPDSGLSESELAGVAELADEFVSKVTSGPQDPRDRSHQQRWAEAQSESDALMRMRYGGHAWLSHHTEAYRQALQNSPGLPASAE